MPNSQTGISVIIVTCNSEPVIASCLRSLANQTSSERIETIVVDNNSVDGTIKLIRKRFPKVKLIEMGHNAGFAAACNRGATDTKNDLLVFLNPDVDLDSETIAALEQALEEQPDSGLVSARLRNPDGQFQPNCRAFPTPSNMFLSRGSVISKIPGLTRLSKSAYSETDSTITKEVSAVSATAVMIKRSIFEQLRGFDERFFMYLEDTDLSYRLHLAGYKNYFVPSAGAVHRWGTGGRGSHWFRTWQHHKSVWKYFLKHHPNGFTLILLPFLLTVNLVFSFLIGGRKGSR